MKWGSGKLRSWRSRYWVGFLALFDVSNRFERPHRHDWPEPRLHSHIHVVF